MRSAFSPTLRVFAAGSLKAAFKDMGGLIAQRAKCRIVPRLGASGILRQAIEDGVKADLFASAGPAHAAKLAETDRWCSPQTFARNDMCLLATPNCSIADGNAMWASLRDQKARIGMSTPGYDPSGDYALQIFEKLSLEDPDLAQSLQNRTMSLTGAPESPKPADGMNLYAWILKSGQADVFLTYRSNCIAAQRCVPGLVCHDLPKPFQVEAVYALTYRNSTVRAAKRFCEMVLSGKGQAILERHGFKPVN